MARQAPGKVERSESWSTTVAPPTRWGAKHFIIELAVVVSIQSSPCADHSTVRSPRLRAAQSDPPVTIP